MESLLTTAKDITIDHHPCPAPGGSVDLSKPRAAVLHTTEGSWESALSEFDTHFAPHFLLGRDQHGETRIAQLIPLGQMAGSLENASGGVETNAWAVAQIEMVGFSSTSPWLPADDVVDALASLMLTLRDEAGVPIERPFKDTMPRLPWATTAFKRRKSGKWGTVAGWFGHVEVPENSHWDPGAIRWADILERCQELDAPAREPYLQVLAGRRGETKVVAERKISEGGLEDWLDTRRLVRTVQRHDDRVMLRIRDHV
jgi:hypothetical protein